MFDKVDTTLSCERELIVCAFLQDFPKGKESSQDFPKGKESSLQLICNADTAFFLCGADPPASNAPTL